MILAFALGCLVAALGMAWEVYAYLPDWPRTVRMSPDGHAYLSMAAGSKVARTYHVRWLLPFLLGQRVRLWQAVSLGSIVLSGGLVAALGVLYGLTLDRALFSVALFGGLTLTRLCVQLPVLSDGPGVCLMLAAVLAHGLGLPWLALALVLVGSAVKETVAPFAFAATLEPVLLAGLLVTVARVVLVKRLEDEPAWATSPWAYARRVHAKHWNVRAWVLPWGVALAGLAVWPPPPELALSLAAGYGVCLLSHDVVRNYQWAFLPLVLLAASVLPAWLTLPALAAHYLHPWRGEV